MLLRLSYLAFETNCDLIQAISCHWTQFLAPDHNVMLLLSIVYAIIGIVGTMGNGFIILIWLRYSSLKRQNKKKSNPDLDFPLCEVQVII